MGKIDFASWNRRTPWKRYMSSKRIFHQKNEKTRFYKSLQRAWQQKSGNRRKNGPYSKNAISMQHKKYGKNIKNRQKWRCSKPKYTLGGPGRPPQPEFASKIRARRVNFSGNSQPKLRFGVFSFFLFSFPFQFSFFLKKWRCFFVFLRISWWWLWWERKDRRQGGKHVNPYTPPNSRSPAPAALLNK